MSKRQLYGQENYVLLSDKTITDFFPTRDGYHKQETSMRRRLRRRMWVRAMHPSSQEFARGVIPWSVIYVEAENTHVVSLSLYSSFAPVFLVLLYSAYLCPIHEQLYHLSENPSQLDWSIIRFAEKSSTDLKLLLCIICYVVFGMWMHFYSHEDTCSLSKDE